MKKNLFSALLLAFGLLAFTGCDDDVMNANPVEVMTNAATAITQTTATVTGVVNGLDITDKGIVFGTSTKPTKADTEMTAGAGEGVINMPIAGLTASTTYYARAYAIVDGKTIYGNEVSFSTLAPGEIAVSVVGTPTVDSTTASINASVVPSGNTIDEVGIYYGTAAGALTTGTKKTATLGTDNTWTNSLTGLTPNTTYYYVVYAKSGSTQKNTTEATFKTIPGPGTVVVTTDSATFTGFGTTLYGTLEAAGLSALTKMGVILSTTAGTTVLTADTALVASGTAVGPFNVTYDTLVQGTTYYYNSYAINAADTVYGTEQSFVAPIVWGGQLKTFVDASTYSQLLFDNSANPGSTLATTYQGTLWTNLQSDMTTANAGTLSSVSIYFRTATLMQFTIAYNDGANNQVASWWYDVADDAPTQVLTLTAHAADPTSAQADAFVTALGANTAGLNAWLALFSSTARIDFLNGTENDHYSFYDTATPANNVVFTRESADPGTGPTA